ncbi:hypothetical protein BT96DRAFT_1003578 [Gymnopus androsaceus JB14]|uniref:PiggyBac transposable element-derived protein domain-containing protein n=1 Tax=Gymnopus androsaceus JB14 TaxID=1447944 RepID=A0A6A4GVK1_9AGAR|nr:hypothetical protein BT96DRAFT_1003578 [Gymnopus androsaceus JB14]
MARRDFATRRIMTTAARIKKRLTRKLQDSEDDRVYMEVLMDLDDEQSDSDGNAPMQSAEPPEAGDIWEDEEDEEDEELLYFRAKDAAQNFSELKDYQTRKQKTVIDQDQWNDKMPDLVDAFLDHVYCRNSGRVYEGVVRERHVILVWSTYEHATYEIPVFNSDRLNNASYIRSGFLPFNPLVNRSLVSLQTVELCKSMAAFLK